MTAEDVYYYFRKVQSESKGRGFRMPKEFESHLNKRFSKPNREALILVTKYFNTKWENIDVYKYMQCGFELFKTFSYVKFLDKRVLNLYIVKDKNLKREMGVNKKLIIKSAKFVKQYMHDNNIFDFKDYCCIAIDNKKEIVSHYLHNKVDKFFFVWTIKLGYLVLSDADRSQLSYINAQYREILAKVDEIKDFFNKLKGSLK